MFSNSRLGLFAALGFLLVFGLSAQTTAGAQEERSNFQKITRWEAEKPELEIIGVQGSGVVIKSDSGFEWLRFSDKVSKEISVPEITQVGWQYLNYCSDSRIMTYIDGNLVYDYSKADFGVDAILGCWRAESYMFILGEDDGSVEVRRHLMRGGVPEAGVVMDQIVNPVAFEHIPGGGLIIIDGLDNKFHTSRWGWTPEPADGVDFYLDGYPVTLEGDLLSLMTFNGEVIDQFQLPSEASNISLIGGEPVFTLPTEEGGATLVAGWPRVGDETSIPSRVDIPYMPDRMQGGGAGLFVQYGNTLTSIITSTVVLSSSHDTYRAFSGEKVTLELWGLNDSIWSSLATGNPNIIGPGQYYKMTQVRRISGGMEFVPPLMRPNQYSFVFGPGELGQFVLTMEGWHETSDIRISAPATASENRISMSCVLDGYPDASEYVSTGDLGAKDITKAIAVGSECELAGYDGWWGEVVDGVNYDFLDSVYTFTVVPFPQHFRSEPKSTTTIPVWVDVFRSGGADRETRQVEILCTDGTEQIYQIPYGVPTRLEVKLEFSEICYLVAFEDEGYDFVGIQEFLDYGPANRYYREGIDIDRSRPVWFEIGELVVHPLDDVGQFVVQQYDDFLGREPSEGELFAWSSDLSSGKQSRVDLVSGFVGSAEYRDAVDPNVRLYQAYFGRVPDSGGLNYWVGVRRDGYSMGLVSDQFALSQEFINTYGDTSDSEFIRLVYENVLGRSPDAGGYAYWEGLLVSGAITRGQLMIYFSESVEYSSLFANRVQVVRVYLGLLGRVPDEAELEIEESRLAAGSSLRDLVSRIIGGSEYEERFFDHYRGDRVNDLRVDQSLANLMTTSKQP